MREQLLNDEQRRDDAHGAVELGPPAQTDQGGSPYQTAFDPGAGNPQGGGLPGVIYAGREPYPGKANTAWSSDLGAVLTEMKTQAKADAIPVSNIRLHGIAGTAPQ